jgi:hypothetical protein
MSEEDKNQCPGSFCMNDSFMFEQIKDEQFIFWDKKTNKQTEVFNHNFKAMPKDMVSWKTASKLEEYGDKEKLWEEIKTYLMHHVFLPDERLYDILTAWVFDTWIVEKWKAIPYLLIKGPMNCGKTRLLETLEAITYRGIFSANMTCAALFRVLELYRPTIFLDETEIYNKEEYSEVTHLLNAGYKFGQKAWRVEHGKDGLMYIKGYDVFGFKALAGTQELAQTLNSRSIVIDMVKNVNRVNFSVNEKIAQALRNRLLLWRFHTLSSISSEIVSLADENTIADENDETAGVYTLLQNFKDGRLIELFYPLLYVSNSGQKNILSFALDMQKEREMEEQTSLQYQCLEALLKCQDQSVDGKILVKYIKEKMNEGADEKERFTTHFITKILSGLGFKKVHVEKGVGIIVSKKMLDYRLQQYKFARGDTLAESSFSSFRQFVTQKESVSDSSLDIKKCEKCGVTIPALTNYRTTETGVLCVYCSK